MSALIDFFGKALAPRPDERPAKRRCIRDSSNTPVLKKIITYVAGLSGLQSFASRLQQPDLESSPTCSRKSYRKQESLLLGQEALAYREEEATNRRYWVHDFIVHKWGYQPSRDAKREKRNRVRAAIKVVNMANSAQKHDPNTARPARSGAGVCRVSTNHCVKPSQRKRQAFSRVTLAMELDDEVWHWFVVRLFENRTRVPAREILEMARTYKNEIIDVWRCRCDNGIVEEEPRLPTIGDSWLKRWRKKHNVSHRTVNLRYKIPRATLLARLRTFWINCIIVRTLFQCFYPNAELGWVGYDQKPLWFNSITAEKTMTQKGSKKVGTAENVSASRLRFTAMTQCRSWHSEEVPPIGVLFRISDSAGSLQNLRNELGWTAESQTLVQGAPKGSYRLSHTLEFITWALPPATVLGKIVCVVLDWFAPHLHTDVDKLVHDLGHVVLRIGGGLTPIVQVEDTHAHRPYNQFYRDLEMSDATESWKNNGGGLLDCSRETVFNRSENAWMSVDHEKCAAGWEHNGISGRPTGSQALPYWKEMHMDDVEAQVVEDIREEIANGTITSFKQYRELLQEYDDHAPIREGMEGAPVYVYDEGGAHAPIGDAGEDEAIGDDGEDEHDEDHDVEKDISKEPEKIDLEEEISKEQDAFDGALQLPALCNGDSSGFPLATQGNSDADPHVLQTPASSKDDCNVVQPHSRDSKLSKAIHYMEDAASKLREVGQGSLATYLDEQAKLHRRRTSSSDPVIVKALRDVTESRWKVVFDRRAEIQAKKEREKQEKKEKYEELHKRLMMNAETKKVMAANKAKEIELKNQQKAAALAVKQEQMERAGEERQKRLEARLTKKTQQQRQQEKARLKLKLAGEVAVRLFKAMVRKSRPSSKAVELKAYMEAKCDGGEKNGRPWVQDAPPQFWGCQDTASFKKISNVDITGKSMDNGIMVYASDAFSKEMFLGTEQGSRNASTCLENFIEMVCPAYKKTVGRRWGTFSLLQQFRGNCLDRLID